MRLWCAHDALLLPVLVLCVVPLACITRSLSSPAEIEAYLSEQAVTVVPSERFVLHSPYDASTTEPYTQVVRAESDAVRALFGDTQPEPARIYLCPIESDDPDFEHAAWRHVGVGALEGGAFDEGFLFVYVPARATSFQALLRASTQASPIRHELAHFYARRAGLQRSRWLDEAIATDVEHGTVRQGTFVPHPYPLALAFARQTAAPGSIARLLRWRFAETFSASEMDRVYREAESLLRFLRERAPAASHLELLQRIHALADAALLALEPEWLAWLPRQDPLDAVRRAVASPLAEERLAGAHILPTFAENRVPDLATRAADELALECLADPAACAEAFHFLVFYRDRALTEVDVARLEASPDPARRVIACTLRARRNEAYDLERARADWRALEQDVRDRLAAPPLLIPGLE